MLKDVFLAKNCHIWEKFWCLVAYIKQVAKTIFFFPSFHLISTKNFEKSLKLSLMLHFLE